MACCGICALVSSILWGMSGTRNGSEPDSAAAIISCVLSRDSTWEQKRVKHEMVSKVYLGMLKLSAALCVQGRALVETRQLGHQLQQGRLEHLARREELGGEVHGDQGVHVLAAPG